MRMLEILLASVSCTTYNKKSLKKRKKTGENLAPLKQKQTLKSYRIVWKFNTVKRLVAISQFYTFTTNLKKKQKKTRQLDSFLFFEMLLGYFQLFLSRFVLICDSTLVKIIVIVSSNGRTATPS